jgi:hypothetical protein
MPTACSVEPIRLPIRLRSRWSLAGTPTVMLGAATMGGSGKVMVLGSYLL